MSRVAADNNGSGLALEDLVALNDEIIALVRAGVPLDHGLLQLGRDLPGRLGTMTRLVAQRLEKGQTLAQIAAADDSPFPPLYRALVRAGTETGRLPETLQLLSGMAQRMIETRAALRVSLIYPIALIALGYTLLMVALLTWVPEMQETYRRFELEPGWLLQGISVLSETLIWWAPWPPLIALAAGIFFWRPPGRRVSLDVPRRRRWPTMRGVRRDSGSALLADIMAVLIQHRVPLDEALVVAGEASGDAVIVQHTRQLATRIRQGERLDEVSAELPPFVSWLILSTRDADHLVRGLRQAASFYREQAAADVRLLSIFLPGLLTIAVGGGIVLIYALVMLGPWYQLLYRLS